ncbi:MAG: translation initiation factor IF-3 [Christensenellaceae bacterium]|nr:translation initiation factor IF-3 [Christensenellaceae bacterium]
MLEAHFYFQEDINIFKELSTNYNINVSEIRLIDSEGQQLGIKSTAEARRMAESKNLDLVMISPTASPPVCRIMDYKKYRFDLIKKEREEKKNRKVVELKDIWLSATIDIGDLDTKAKQARRFIEDGDRVRLSIRMKGRQQVHPDISIGVMEDFYARLKEIAQVEKKPTQDGRTITMILVPLSKK